MCINVLWCKSYIATRMKICICHIQYMLYIKYIYKIKYTYIYMSCIILYIAWSAFYNTCRQHVFLVLYIYVIYIYAMTRNRRHVQCVYIVEYTIHTLDLYISVYICICYIIQYIWYSPAGIALWRRCMVVILYSCRYIGVCNMYNMYIYILIYYIVCIWRL